MLFRSTNPGAALTNPTHRPVLSLSHGQPAALSTGSCTQHTSRTIPGLFYGATHRYPVGRSHNMAEKRQTGICGRTAQHSQTVYAVYSRKRTHHLNCASWYFIFAKCLQKFYLPKQKLLQINLLSVTVFSLMLYFLYPYFYLSILFFI